MTMVHWKVNDRDLSGYLAYPSDRKGPGVVILHEWWGLVPHIKNVTDRFAAEGFVALAPDLYHGRIAATAEEARQLMLGMSAETVEKDLHSTIQYLISDSTTTGGKVGMIGFSMGGGLSIFGACSDDSVGACVVYYGSHPVIKANLKSLKAPLLGLYAENDKIVSVESVRELERQLKQLGKQATIHIYPKVAHSFFNDENHIVYDDLAARDAWRWTIAFLKRELKEQPVGGMV